MLPAAGKRESLSDVIFLLTPNIDFGLNNASRKG